MLIVGVEVVPVVVVLHLAGGDLAVIRGQSQHLVAGGLDGAALVAVDMAADGGENALIGAQDGGDHRGVGQGAAHQKMHVGLRRLAGGLDLFPRGGAVFILAVAHGLLHVGAHQALHDGGVRPLQIVAVKIDHMRSLLSDPWWYFTAKTPVCKDGSLIFTHLAKWEKIVYTIQKGGKTIEK